MEVSDRSTHVSGSGSNYCCVLLDSPRFSILVISVAVICAKHFRMILTDASPVDRKTHSDYLCCTSVLASVGVCVCVCVCAHMSCDCTRSNLLSAVK